MEVTKEQAMAYTEVIEVLKYMSKEEVNKIPHELIDYYKNNMDITYNYKIDEQKNFEEQVLSEKAKIVLAILFRDYWATESQKERIKSKEKYDLQQLEEEKQKNYEGDIFKNNKEETINEPVKETMALVDYSTQSWYKKFINFMKKIFGRRNIDKKSKV